MKIFEEKQIIHGKYSLEIFRVLRNGHREDKPFDLIEFENLVTNVGGALALDAIIGTAITPFSNANANIGIGDSLTAPAVGQTDLQAAANKLRRAMLATFPSRAGQVMTFKSTFAAADANWVWNEIALFNAAAAGTMLSRALVTAPFTKTAGLAIDVTFTLTMP